MYLETSIQEWSTRSSVMFSVLCTTPRQVSRKEPFTSAQSTPRGRGRAARSFHPPPPLCPPQSSAEGFGTLSRYVPYPGSLEIPGVKQSQLGAEAAVSDKSHDITP